MSRDKTLEQPHDPSTHILVDVLPRERYEQVHIPGAHNACVYEVTFIDQIRAISHDPEAPLLLYGDSATSNEASIAVEKLARAGYRNLTILQGGLKAWRDAGRPVEGASPEAAPSDDTSLLPDGNYAIDLQKSRIGWTGRNPSGKHWGNVPLARGELSARDGQIRGRFEVALAKIDNLDLAGNPLMEVLIKHLLSDDFFWAERFPTATFTLDSAHPIPGAASTQPNHHVKGALELRGVTAPLDFAATLNRTSEGEWVVEAHFDIDRTRWEALYGSSRFFAHLGKHVVYDLVSLELRLVLSS